MEEGCSAFRYGLCIFSMYVCMYIYNKITGFLVHISKQGVYLSFSLTLPFSFQDGVE